MATALNMSMPGNIWERKFERQMVLVGHEGKQDIKLFWPGRQHNSGAPSNGGAEGERDQILEA